MLENMPKVLLICLEQNEGNFLRSLELTFVEIKIKENEEIVEHLRLYQV